MVKDERSIRVVCLNGYRLVISKSQQVSKVCVAEGLLSSFKLVPECHTHPENQIRSSMIGFTEIRIMGESGSDATRLYVAFNCKWQASMRVAGTAKMRNLVFIDESLVHKACMWQASTCVAGTTRSVLLHVGVQQRVTGFAIESRR